MCSLGVNIFMLIYVWFIVKKWVLNEDDFLITITKYINEDNNVVKMNETSIVPVIGIMDYKNFNPLKYDEEMQRHVNINFVYTEYNYLKSFQHKKTLLKARGCRESDFKGDHRTKFKKLRNVAPFMCPEDLNKIVLIGSS